MIVLYILLAFAVPLMAILYLLARYESFFEPRAPASIRSEESYVTNLWKYFSRSLAAEQSEAKGVLRETLRLLQQFDQEEERARRAYQEVLRRSWTFEQEEERARRAQFDRLELLLRTLQEKEIHTQTKPTENAPGQK